MQKISFYSLIIYAIIFAFIVPSCTKMEGHTLVPVSATASTTGIGPIVPGGTNTVIFQVAGGSRYIWTTPNYSAGFISFLGISSISSANSANDGFNVTYFGATTGTFDATSLTIMTSGLNLEDEQQEKVNITEMPITPSSLSGTFTGTIKGTFDGYMLDKSKSPSLSVRVYGSFNITQ